MGFNEILKELVLRVDGAVGAIFIDREGEAVAHDASLQDEEIKLMGAHYGIVWETLQGISRRCFHAPSVEAVFFLEKGICLMRPVQTEYAVLLLLGRFGNVGQARRWIRWVAKELEKEM